MINKEREEETQVNHSIVGLHLINRNNDSNLIVKCWSKYLTFLTVHFDSIVKILAWLSL